MNIDIIAIFITKAIIGIVETFLGVRFILKILGASQQAPFVRWIYSTSDTVLDPFQGMFPSPALGSYFIIELNTIFAMIVYVLIGYAMIKFIDFIYKQFVQSFNEVGKSSDPKKETAKHP